MEDRKSTAGYCIYHCETLVAWSSKKQKAMSCSSAKSKYIALSSLATEIVWLHSLLLEIGIKP